RSWPSSAVPSDRYSRFAGPVTGRTASGIEPFDEPVGEANPDVVLLRVILDTVFEVGVVVDLDDEDAVIGLLEIDAVEAVADAARCPQARVEDERRRFCERK